jgi:hypothetical protein
VNAGPRAATCSAVIRDLLVCRPYRRRCGAVERG